MTTISPAGAHRPPTLPAAATPLHSLKRQASSQAIGRTDGQPSRYSVGEDPGSKRQKRDSPGSAVNSSFPLFKNGESANPTADGLVRVQHTRRVALEFIDGFFVGSEGIKDSQPQTPAGCRSATPSLPQRPWKHSLATRRMTDGVLSNTGVRKRTDMQVQSVPYKTDSPRDAPKFMADSKYPEGNLIYNEG
jgi:hypothetical protein